MQTVLDTFRLDGKIALVTGSASGLGAAIAIALAQAGAQVACHGNRRAATETAETIGGNATAFRADLGSTSGAEDLFPQVHDTFGKVDILINNAGTIHRDAAVDTSLESWQQVLQVNLTSVFQLSQLVARDIIRRNAASRRRQINRQDHQHRLAAQLPGRHPRPRLRSLQGRRRPAHQGARQRVGRPRESRSTPSLPATSPPPTPRPCRPTKPATARSSNASPPPAGASHPTSPAPRSSSPHPHPTTSPERYSPSMEAGWAVSTSVAKCTLVLAERGTP